MIKLYLGEIRLIHSVLPTLMNQQLPIKACWELDKLFDVVEKEYQRSEKMRNILVQKHGKQIYFYKNSEGVETRVEENEELNDNIEYIIRFEVSKDNLVSFYKEFDEILSEEITVEEYEPLSMDLFIDEIKITPAQFKAIKKIFK